MENKELSWSEFERVDMRVGTIVEVLDFRKAKNPSFILRIDFGKALGIKKTSAQITTKYTKDDLLGKQIVGVVNFPDKQIANVMSQCLVLGAVDRKDVILLHPGMPVENGLRIG